MQTKIWYLYCTIGAVWHCLVNYVNKHTCRVTGGTKENGIAVLRPILPLTKLNWIEWSQFVVCVYCDVSVGVWQKSLTVWLPPNGQILQQRTFVHCYFGLSAHRWSLLNMKSIVYRSVKMRVDCIKWCTSLWRQPLIST